MQQVRSGVCRNYDLKFFWILKNKICNIYITYVKISLHHI